MSAIPFAALLSALILAYGQFDHLCLDTNILIAVMRNRAVTIARLQATARSSVKVPEIVRAELLFGCLTCKDPDLERRKVDHVLAPFDWLPFGGEAVQHYAAIRVDLERAGKLIGPNDLLIAATARAVGAVLVTSNTAEFARVPGLVMEDWS